MRFRWEEFSPPERREFANFTVNLITEVAGPTEEWALKSQTAALVAEVLFSPPFVLNSLSVFLLYLLQEGIMTSVHLPKFDHTSTSGPGWFGIGRMLDQFPCFSCLWCRFIVS